MKCPKCDAPIKETDVVCPYCEYDLSKAKNIDKTESKEITNALCLRYITIINLVLSIISAIIVWVNFSTTEVNKTWIGTSLTYTDKMVNWYGVFGGIGLIIGGITIYLVLMTIVDIYNKVKK